jgi:hypothetical protein
MALTQNPVNIGAAADDGTGDPLRVGAGKWNGDIGATITAINNLLTLIGAGNETSVDLGAFSETIIPDGRTVKQALQSLETALTNADRLDVGYTQAGTVAFPAAGDPIETAIAKLHAFVAFLDGLDAIRFAGALDASLAVYPTTGTGLGGAVNRGDLWRITVAGTIDTVLYNVGDQVIARIDNAGVTSADWVKVDNTDQVLSVFGRQGAITSQNGDYTASQVTNVPGGGVVGNTVQLAIDELDLEKTAKATLTTKGDIYAATAASTPARQAVGLSGEALIADSSTATGVAYSAQLERRFDQADIATTATLTAATSVDVANIVTFAQTTANATVTIPNPTVATKRRVITLLNTGTSTLGVLFTAGAGFYLPPGARTIAWNGSVWVAEDANLSVLAESGSADIATVSYTTLNVWQDVGISIVLPSAGTWEIRGSIHATVADSDANNVLALFDNSISTTVPIANTETRLGGINGLNTGTDGVSGSQAVLWRYTLASGSKTLQVKARKTNGTVPLDIIDSTATGRSRIAWNKVSGHAPILGTTVDSIYARHTIGTAYTNAPVDVTGFVTADGNIPHTAGVFSLKAGKRYHLSANFSVTNVTGTPQPLILWVDAVTNVALVANGGAASINASASYGTPYNSTRAELVYTPAADQNVKLRIVSGLSLLQTINLWNGSSNAGSTDVSIQQLGSTAFTQLSRQRTTLGAQFGSTTHNTFLDVTGLTAIIVPSGQQRIKVHAKTQIQNNGNGSMYVDMKLVNVTAGNTDITNANAYGANVGAASGFTDSAVASSYFEIVTNFTVQTTVKLQARKNTSGGAPNTGQNFFVDTGSYIEIEQAL